MLVRDIMHSDVLTAHPDMTLVELDALPMNHQISGAPVVDDQGEVIGMVSKTDVIRCLSEEFVQLDRPVSEVKVSEIMTPNVLTAEPAANVVEVAETMLARRVHRVVIYENGKMEGIVSSFDMLRAVVALGKAR